MSFYRTESHQSWPYVILHYGESLVIHCRVTKGPLMSFYRIESYQSSTVVIEISWEKEKSPPYMYFLLKCRSDFVNQYGNWRSADASCRWRLISLYPFFDYLVLPQMILQDGDSLRLFTVGWPGVTLSKKSIRGPEVTNSFRLTLQFFDSIWRPEF